MSHDVFIGHASKDLKLAEKLATFLEERSIQCWYAPRNVPAGELWPPYIPPAIRGSKVVVILLSEHSINNPNCLTEVTTAFAAQVTIIPIKVADISNLGMLDYHTQLYQWIDAFSQPFENYLEKIYLRISEITGKKSTTRPASIPLPGKQTNPSSQGQNKNSFRVFLWAIPVIICVGIAVYFVVPYENTAQNKNQERSATSYPAEREQSFVQESVKEQEIAKQKAEDQAEIAAKKKELLEIKRKTEEAKREADAVELKRREVEEKAKKAQQIADAESKKKPLPVNEQNNSLPVATVQTSQATQPPVKEKSTSPLEQLPIIYIPNPINNDKIIGKVVELLRQEINTNGSVAATSTDAQYAISWGGNARVGKEGPDNMGQFSFSLRLQGDVVDVATGQKIKTIAAEEMAKGRDNESARILDSLTQTVAKRLAQQAKFLSNR